MKNLPLIIFYLCCSIICYSQQQVPYFESFEDPSVANDPTAWANIGWSYEIGSDDGTKFTNRIYSELGANSTHVIKIRVEDTDDTNSGGVDRVEIKKTLTTSPGTSFYYSWNILIPSDSFPDSHDWHIIGQFIQGDPTTLSCKDNGPIFKIAYVKNDFSPDLKRDLAISYGYKCNGGTRYEDRKISDAIVKDQWFKLIFRFKWELDSTGFMQGWIDYKPIQESAGELILGNEGDTATTFYSRNLEVDTISYQLRNNYFKTGHYRGSSSTGSSIMYVDDFRVTNELPPKDKFTKLLPEYCNTTLAINNQTIDAYNVEAGSMYKFYLKDNDGNQIWANRSGPDPKLDLNDIENVLTANTTYEVRVREFSHDYSEVCNITTQKWTRIKDEYCGTTLNSSNMVITAYPIIGATKYKFKFKNPSGALKVHERTTPSIDLNELGSWFQPLTTYEVRVRAITNTASFGYADACPITTPSNYGSGSRVVISSIDELHVNTVYPNPTNDVITIDLPNNNTSKVWLTNLLGKKYFECSSSDSVTINLKELGLNPGLYLVYIKTGENFKYAKVLLEK